MREITSVEIHVLVDELRERIEGGFVRKFYEIGNGAFRFQFYSSASGNTTVYCKLLFAFNETRFAEAAEEPTAFAMGIRKHIEGAAVTGIAQHGTDRIIILGLSSKSGRRSLIIEMFGKGNMVLVDGNGTIEQCLSVCRLRRLTASCGAMPHPLPLPQLYKARLSTPSRPLPCPAALGPGPAVADSSLRR